MEGWGVVIAAAGLSWAVLIAACGFIWHLMRSDDQNSADQKALRERVSKLENEFYELRGDHASLRELTARLPTREDLGVAIGGVVGELNRGLGLIQSLLTRGQNQV